MDPSRFVLTDRQWCAIEPLCLGSLTVPGRNGADTRLFLEAVLWIVRTDAPWRDLPPEFGNWNSTFGRFRRWVQAHVFKRIFDALRDKPDMEYAMIDATIVKVHRHGMGAKGGSKPGHRQVEGRVDNQDARSCACTWKPRALRPHARQTLRYAWRRAFDPGCPVRCDARGQGIRQQLDHRRRE